MTLQDIFNGNSTATLIYRGDCTKRGYWGSPLFEEGGRFEFLAEKLAVTFVAESVKVMPAGWISEEDYDKHVFGKGVAPYFPEDSETDIDAREPCTVIEFRKDSVKPIAASWISQQENRLA